MTETTPSGSWVYLDALPHQARRRITVSGADVHRFFQGTVSQDLDALVPGRALAGSLLTVKGKIVSELILLAGDRAGSLAEILVPADTFDAVLSSLNRHIIMDDVTLTAEEGSCALWWGDIGPPCENEPGVRTFETTHPAHGHLLVGPDDALERCLRPQRAAGPAAWNLRRVTEGTPAWGFEITPDRFPPEVGFVSAVSYSKGCFMGQEPLARIHARGRTNWVMVRVETTEAQPEIPELPIELSAATRESAGRWTTAVAQVNGESSFPVVGLAVVHRSVAEPGTELQAGGAALTVTSRPLGDDGG